VSLLTATNAEDLLTGTSAVLVAFSCSSVLASDDAKDEVVKLIITPSVKRKKYLILFFIESSKKLRSFIDKLYDWNS